MMTSRMQCNAEPDDRRRGARRGTIVLFPESAIRQRLEWHAPLWVWGVVLLGEIVLSIWSA
jgi:hypothetical protein